MSISVRDKTALCAAIIGGPLFGFLATKLNGTGHRGILVAARFVFLFIPAAVLLSERLELLIWQTSVVSFAVYVLAWNFGTHKIDLATGGAGLSFPQVVFVLLGCCTVFSAPVPLYFCSRRIGRPYRYYVAVGMTIAVILLWWL
jgi:hypothetical protein